MEISMFTPVFYKKLAPIFAFTTLGLVAPRNMLAQVDTGAISGTVKDASGGVIPGAKVTIINEDTGLSISTTSGSAGEYVFSPRSEEHTSELQSLRHLVCRLLLEKKKKKIKKEYNKQYYTI